MIHCGYVAAYVGLPQCIQCEDVSLTITLYALRQNNICCHITTMDY